MEINGIIIGPGWCSVFAYLGTELRFEYGFWPTRWIDVGENHGLEKNNQEDNW